MKTKRKISSVLGLAVAAAAMATAFGGGVANADTRYESISPISTSPLSASCLDVRKQDDYYHANARVQLWSCSGALEQQWSSHPYAQVPVGEFGVLETLYQVKNLRSGMCMEVRGGGTALGTQVDQIPCGSGSIDSISNQLWSENPTSPNSGTYIMAPWSGRSRNLCLDVQGDSTSNGTRIQQWTCNYTDAQIFYNSPS